MNVLIIVTSIVIVNAVDIIVEPNNVRVDTSNVVSLHAVTLLLAYTVNLAFCIFVK